MPLILYGEPGWGSAIVELQLGWYGLDYRFEPVGDLIRSAESRAALAPVNPWRRCRPWSSRTAG
ncbi:MAG: hypothetical protein R3C69_01635 [Geminicoccaceae bacterium]